MKYKIDIKNQLSTIDDLNPDVIGYLQLSIVVKNKTTGNEEQIYFTDGKGKTLATNKQIIINSNYKTEKYNYNKLLSEFENFINIEAKDLKEFDYEVKNIIFEMFYDESNTSRRAKYKDLKSVFTCGEFEQFKYWRNEINRVK